MTMFSLKRAATSGTKLFLIEEMMPSIFTKLNSSVTVSTSVSHSKSQQAVRNHLSNDFLTLTRPSAI
ncbi:unnamed protein product [Phytophthora fragariaefolia]|uniref:Unnamed protein product n=1 Tax=Phytophthora fragariaefolia TaxID=1490495 RepID=A0A9W7D1F8_9STRA|nr:unnamed protein product [Phytophthora fragariaefolia]